MLAEQLKDAAMTAPVLDLDHLARYSGGDGVLEAELFGLLMGQIDACVTALDRARLENDWARAAHTLKGAARGVGAMALGDACAAAEARPLDAEAAEAVRKAALEARAAMQAAQE